jgi:hypothetical protein
VSEREIREGKGGREGEERELAARPDIPETVSLPYDSSSFNSFRERERGGEGR